jgi:outer membrane protein
MMMESKSILLKSMFVVFVVWSATDTAISQTHAGDDVPDAPQVQSISRLVAEAALSKEVGVVQVTNGGADTQSKARNRLTRTEAEKMAVKNNPRMSVSQLLALAQRQVVREVQAAKFPTTDAALTAVEAENGSRISAGSLTSSRLLEHAGAGVNITQLITDFGRTTNLVTSSKLQEKAQNANVLATQLDITLATDQAFYNALEGQELLKVAGQNVSARQALQAQFLDLTTRLTISLSTILLQYSNPHQISSSWCSKVSASVRICWH